LPRAVRKKHGAAREDLGLDFVEVLDKVCKCARFHKAKKILGLRMTSLLAYV
jgi:hypothetical protein